NRPHRERRVAERAADAQAVARQRLRPLRPHEEGHVRARLRQPPAEIAAGAAGAEDQEAHGLLRSVPNWNRIIGNASIRPGSGILGRHLATAETSGPFVFLWVAFEPISQVAS